MVGFDIKATNIYDVECFSNYHFVVPKWVPWIGDKPILKRRRPKLKWRDGFKNLVTTVGKNKVLDATFKTGILVPDPTTTPTIAVTGGGSSGGSLGAGAYYLKYSFYNSLGETNISTESAQFTVSSGNKPRVTVQALPAGATGWRVYLTAAAGGTGTEKKYADFTATPIDLLIAQANNGNMPSSNTAFYTPLWYVGLKGSGSAVAGDTMSSHSGWSELTSYSNATRPAFTPGSISSGSVDNSASKAVFNINATDTIVGAFMVDDANISGTFGTLYGAGDFSASRSVASGDTLNTTVTLSQS